MLTFDTNIYHTNYCGETLISIREQHEEHQETTFKFSKNKKIVIY